MEEKNYSDTSETDDESVLPEPESVSDLFSSLQSDPEFLKLIKKASAYPKEKKLDYFLLELPNIKNNSRLRNVLKNTAAYLMEAPLGEVPIYAVMRFLEAYPHTAAESFRYMMWAVVTFGRTWSIGLKAGELNHTHFLSKFNTIKNQAIIPLSVTFTTLFRTVADIYAGIIMDNPTYSVDNEEFFSIMGSIFAFSICLLAAPSLLSKLSGKNSVAQRFFHQASHVSEFFKKTITFAGIFYTFIAIFGNMSLATVDILTIKMALGFSLLVGLSSAIASEFELPNVNVATYIPYMFRSLAAVAYEFLTLSLLIRHQEDISPYAFIPYVLAPLVLSGLILMLTHKLGSSQHDNEEEGFQINRSRPLLSRARTTLWHRSKRHAEDDEQSAQKNTCTLF